MKRIGVRLGARSYDIVIGSGALKKCGLEIGKLDIGSDAVIVTNSRIRSIYGNAVAGSLMRYGFASRFEMIPDTEKAKSFPVLAALINRLGRYDRGRKIFLAALGGGVTGDLAGFAAAIYKRGIPYVQLPTTLLAQVDSAIGGKTAVDLSAGKNLAGAFYQPSAVISDVSILRTLGPRQIRSGLSEIIKYGVIKDASLFDFIESNCDRLLRGDPGAMELVVTSCSRIKSRIVSKDEFDRKGERAILNFGHTIGHAIEAASSYSGRYNHGEAVAIGMLAASDISVEMGTMSAAQAGRIEALISRVGLPTSARGLSAPSVYAAQLHDKKFVGKTNRFVLPTRVGNAVVMENIPQSAIRNALKGRILL